jgi:hypothetical protein
MQRYIDQSNLTKRKHWIYRISFSWKSCPCSFSTRTNNETKYWILKEGGIQSYRAFNWDSLSSASAISLRNDSTSALVNSIW